MQRSSVAIVTMAGMDRLRIRAGIIDFIGVFVVAALLSDELGADVYGLLGINTALNVIYHGAMELTVGRSLGKRRTGLAIVSTAGGHPTRSQIMIRNLARVIDILPNFYIVGLIVVRTEPKGSQRIGDRLARTTVQSDHAVQPMSRRSTHQQN